MFGADGYNTDLGGAEPHGQSARVFFDQQSKRPLIAAEGGAVNDIGRYLFPVAVGVFHAEFGREQHIDLNRNDGVFFAEYVFALNIQLGPVEGGLVDPDPVVDAVFIQQLLHDALRLIPLFGRALIFVQPRRIPLGKAEGAVLPEPDGFQTVARQLDTAVKFLGQLIGAKDQVPLGNGELPHPDQAVHFAGILIAEKRGGLPETHGQIAVGTGTVQENLILEGTGHGAESKAVFGIIVGIPDDEHAVQIVIPVA